MMSGRKSDEKTPASLDSDDSPRAFGSMPSYSFFSFIQEIGMLVRSLGEGSTSVTSDECRFGDPRSRVLRSATNAIFLGILGSLRILSKSNFLQSIIAVI